MDLFGYQMNDHETSQVVQHLDVDVDLEDGPYEFGHVFVEMYTNLPHDSKLKDKEFMRRYLGQCRNENPRLYAKILV